MYPFLLANKNFQVSFVTSFSSVSRLNFNPNYSYNFKYSNIELLVTVLRIN